ncbi:MAG: hypothetical protein R3C53_00305 [Pirellulaceae bacterium]
MDSHQRLNQILQAASVSRIVYALVMPETEQVVDNVLDGRDCEAKVGREAYHRMFREAWTQKQDAMHEEFFETWKNWASPVLQFDPQQFAFQYPTGGASEALRESIHAYAARARREGFTPRLHLFEGEYEGYAAYAAAAGIETCSHNRHDWQQAIERLTPHDQFYLSQPSAIDGMVWDAYDQFMQQLVARSPGTELMLDVTYVGCVARKFSIDASYPNIPAIFFSLSKPAGVYYHRIGGMLARDEYPGLFGNKWFKNLTSLKIGTEFMRRYSVCELPTRYRSVQVQVVEEVNQELGLTLMPADVMLLAIGQPSPTASELESFLQRGSVGEQCVRVCLTPRMAHVIDPKLNPHVAARDYERFGQS